MENKMMQVKKQAIIVHSGGMDSSLCLALAIREFGAKNVLSMSFSYGQRHSRELEQADKICRAWGVDHITLTIDCLQEITENALMDANKDIIEQPGSAPNTLVVGRNGLMARLAAIHADHLGANCIYLGVIEVEAANSGYRDCSRAYMDLLEKILRMDLANEAFEIRTPVVNMTKCETMELGYQLGVLEFLLKETITCYRGVPEYGCGDCPSCLLRNEGIEEFISKYPAFKMPY
jgi:7-cyano-7-deazaguanine synthase